MYNHQDCRIWYLIMDETIQQWLRVWIMAQNINHHYGYVSIINSIIEPLFLPFLFATIWWFFRIGVPPNHPIWIIISNKPSTFVGSLWLEKPLELPAPPPQRVSAGPCPAGCPNRDPTLAQLWNLSGVAGGWLARVPWGSPWLPWVP